MDITDHHPASPVRPHLPSSQAQADFWHPTGSSNDADRLIGFRMAIKIECIVQCDHCGTTGHVLPIRVCQSCQRHTCRECGLAAGRQVVPPGRGFLESVANALEVRAGACPFCLDRREGPEPVVVRLPSW